MKKKKKEIKFHHIGRKSNVSVYRIPIWQKRVMAGWIFNRTDLMRSSVWARGGGINYRRNAVMVSYLSALKAPLNTPWWATKVIVYWR